MGCPARINKLKQMAEELLKAKGDTNSIGKNWPNRAPWSVALIGPLVISALHQYDFFCDNFNKKI